MEKTSRLLNLNTWLWMGMLLTPFFIFWKGMFFGLAVCVLLAIWFFSYRLDWGWYVLVFLSPMWHWIIRFTDYWYVFQEYPQLLGIYAPAVDFWTLFLLIAFGVNRVRGYLLGKKPQVHLPLFGAYVLFLASAVVSLWYVPQIYVGETLHFLLRFLLFFYLGFVVLGTNIVENKDILQKSLLAFASSGLCGAIMGAVSIPLGVWQGGIIPRAVPFAIRGWAPFGDQHIFIGEAIVATSPIWAYLWHSETHQKKKKWFLGITVFVLLIGLLTFSRTVWIVFAVASIALVLLGKGDVSFSELLKKWWWMVVAFCLLAPAFLVFLLTTANVGSSNTTRFTLLDIALYFFKEHPIIGNGPGMYPWLASDIFLFQMEIGGLQQPQGWIQQLLSEQGIVGLAAFSFFMFLLFRHLIRRYYNHQFTKEARMMALLGIFLVGMPLLYQLFGTHVYTSKLWVPIALAISGFLVYKKDRHYASLSNTFVKKHPWFNL